MATCQAPVDHVAQQRHDHELLLEDAEHLAHGLDGVERLRPCARCRPRRPARDRRPGVRPARPTARSASVVGVGVAGGRHRQRRRRGARPTRQAVRCAVAAATRSSPMPSGTSIVCFSTVPSLSTTTSSAAERAERDELHRPHAWPPRVRGPTTTPVRLVRFDSSRLVSGSICSTSPWARAKKSRTSSADGPGSRAGRRRWSTKNR